MKKITFILISILLTFSLCSCGIESVDEHESRKQAEAESLSKSLEDQKNADDTSENSNTQTDDDQSNETQNDSPDQNQNSQNNQNLNDDPNSQNNQTVSNSNTGTTTADNNISSENKKTDILVKLTLQCVNVYGMPALNGVIDFSKTDEGYWLKNVEIPAKEGDSVLDVISNAKILGYLTFEKNGNYITTINGLGAGMAGSESGWKYSVNNTNPSLDSASYKIKNSDSVTWYYVTKTSQNLN